MKMLPVLIFCLPVVAHADWLEFDRDFEQDKPWVEVAAQLPAFPKPENLIEFNVSAVTPHRHYVDAKSISVGSDNVVRYTVVIDTAGGARNVSFEGLRCESGERRLYAYGHADGTWSRARNAGWESIKLRSLLSYQKALFEDHFCPNGIRVRDGLEAAQNLRRATR